MSSHSTQCCQWAIVRLRTWGVQALTLEIPLPCPTPTTHGPQRHTLDPLHSELVPWIRWHVDIPKRFRISVHLPNLSSLCRDIRTITTMTLWTCRWHHTTPSQTLHPGQMRGFWRVPSCSTSRSMRPHRTLPMATRPMGVRAGEHRSRDPGRYVCPAYAYGAENNSHFPVE